MDMKKTTYRILQHHFSVSISEDDLENYLMVVEIIDEVPRHSYVEPMSAFKYWDENMPYYVYNSN